MNGRDSEWFPAAGYSFFYFAALPQDLGGFWGVGRVLRGFEEGIRRDLGGNSERRRRSQEGIWSAAGAPARKFERRRRPQKRI